MGDEQRRLPPGAVVRLSFPLRDLLTTLCHEHPEEFAMCVKCGFIAEFFYKLHCAHYLCDRCIGSAGSFTCWKDGIRTKIQTPLTTPPTRNAQLIEAAMLCPGCSQPIMFKDIKAHINQQHPGLWKQENQRTKIDEKAYGGHAVKNQGPPANTVYPSGGAEDKAKAAKNFGSSYKAYSGNQQPVAEQRPRQQRFEECPPISKNYRQYNQHQAVQRDFSGQRTNKPDNSANKRNDEGDEFSKSPGISFVTPTDIKERSRAPLHAGYGSDAGTAGLGRYPQTHKEDDLQRDSAVQQAPRPDESTALREPAEEEYMEVTESSPPSLTTVPIPDSEQQMADISNISACRYCSKTFHVEKIQEHQDECFVLLTRAWKLFSPHILKYYEAHVKGGAQGSKQGTTSLEGDIKDTIMYLPEFKTLLKHLMDECYEEHLSEHGQGGHDVFAKIEEHVCTCQTFHLRCAYFWSQVKPGYNEAKENTGCSTNVHAVECFRATAESSLPFPNTNADKEPQQKADVLPKTTECAYCLTQWDVDKIEKHVEKCEDLFARFYELFKREIVAHYKQYLEDGTGEATQSGEMVPAKDGLLSESVGQKWFRLVMDALQKQHLSKPWKDIPENFAGFEERIRNDQSFLSMCKELLRQVVLEYLAEHSKGLRLHKKDGHDAFQGKEESKSIQSLGAPSGGSLRKGKEETEGNKECPYCCESWDHRDYDEHLASCQREFLNAAKRSSHPHQDCDQQPRNDVRVGKQQVGNHVELKATPTRELEKTTAAMSFKKKYSLKDVKGLADGILIPFKEKLNPELACCICKALTPTGLKDGKGHTYCAYCTRVHTDALGLFTCSLCGWQAAPSEMSSNGEEWGILEKLTAACPNDKPKCTYQGTFKDVLEHYKSCALKSKVECPLCKSLHDRKTLAFHMAENCPKRLVECKFCNSDIEAWEKEIHEGSCRHRPGTCKYCLQEFSTIIELEEEHQPQCPKMPVKCSFYQLGCSFSAARSDVVVHEATTKHTAMLMEHVCLLKAENESLKRTIESQEKKFQSIINNIKDSLSKIENRTNVAFERRQASAGTRQRDIEERLAAVEQKLRSYQLPFEQLLRSISDLK